jgi:hypothetical protein
MRTASTVRQAAAIAAFTGLLAIGRCGNGNMVTSPAPAMSAPTPPMVSTPTPVAGSNSTYLYGQVVDAATGEALADVLVSALQIGGGYHSSQTAADGTYRIDNLVPLLETSLRAGKMGYLDSKNKFRPQGALRLDLAITKFRRTPGGTEYAD